MAKKRDWLKKVGEWLINQSKEQDINKDAFEKKEIVNFFKLNDSPYKYLEEKDKIKIFLLNKVNEEIEINKIESKRNSIIFNYILEQCRKKIDKIFL